MHRMRGAFYYRLISGNTNTLLLVLFILFTALGCKKEKPDGEMPSIQIHLPNESQSYNYMDDIFITATITDNENLEMVRVQITNEQNQSFLHQLEYNNVGKEKQISTYITHDNLHLPSGVYYVKITARDRSQETYAFRKIQLVEAPLELSRIYIIRGNSDLPYIDTLGTNAIMPYQQLTQSYIAGATNSRNQLMVAHGHNQMNVLEANTLNNLSTYAYSTDTDVLKTFYDPYTQSIYTGTSDGFILETDRNGNTSTYSFMLNQRIRNLMVTENFIFADIENLTQTIRTISVFVKATRTIIQSVQVNFDMKELLYLGNEDKILVVGNENGEGVLKYYNRQTNFFNQVFTAHNNSSIHAAWPTATGQFIVANQNGLTTYNYQLTMLSTGIEMIPSKILHEKISGNLFALTNNGVYRLNSNATQQLAFYSAIECRDILFLYNK